MRRRFASIFLALALASAAPVGAAETLNYGPAPSWAVSPNIPEGETSDDRPIEILLLDQQIQVEAGKTIIYTESAFKIRTADGLAAGNLSIPWQPATQTVTVNKLQIRRPDETIDVLASGQKFTTIRRETNLEAAMLDGQLTANIQPEGLRVGDTVVLATTFEHADPVLKDHVQLRFGTWDGTPIRNASARVVWPADLDMRLRFSGGLEETAPRTEGNRKILELKMKDVEPLIPPQAAPSRFQMGRLVEGSNYSNWGQVGALMQPLYQAAAVIPRTGPLREEVEKIRSSTPDPLLRAEQALDLVQNRVRYVALLMGQGGYVPASAEETWSRRYGDCKAKTALLLAMLEELGIDAEPVAVHSSLGDALAERPPMISAFDHVLVRSRIGGKDYWLDGTRTGDAGLETIEVPALHWGLPLVRGAELVRLMPPPLTEPQSDQLIEIHAEKGVYAPAPILISETIRGDEAVGLNALLTSFSGAQRDEMFRHYAKRHFDAVEVADYATEFDEVKRELHIKVEGEATLDWQDGWYFVPSSTLAYKPDFHRPKGLHADAPLAVGYPQYGRNRVIIRLPEGFAGHQKTSKAVKRTLVGVEYSREISVEGDIVTVEKSQRSIAPEVSYASARAEEAGLKSLHDQDVYLRVPDNYRPTEQDLTALLRQEPATAEAYFNRGLTLLNSQSYEQAIADFSSALELDPDDEWALANRAIAHAWKDDAEAAERDLAATEAIAPANPVAARARGLMAMKQGDFDAAVKFFSRSLQEDSSNDFALRSRMAAYQALGDDESALADSEKLLASSSSDPNVRLFRANLLRSKGDAKRALGEADLLVEEHPQSDYALVAAARIYAALGASGQAAATFDRALALQPRAFIYVNRAQTHSPFDFEARTADLDEALALEPDHPEALAAKASLLTRQGKHSDALKLYDRLVEIVPEGVDARAQRAIALHRAGRASEAEKLFASLGTEAKTANEFNNLCWTKATEGVLLEMALEECRKAVELAPEAGPYLDSLGMALLRLGKLDEALQAYDSAVSKRTGSSSLMGRAFVHERKGDQARADADRAEALKTDPQAESRFASYGLEFKPRP